MGSHNKLAGKQGKWTAFFRQQCVKLLFLQFQAVPHPMQTVDASVQVSKFATLVSPVQRRIQGAGVGGRPPEFWPDSHCPPKFVQSSASFCPSSPTAHLRVFSPVDYYSLLTWKTLAICIFGTEVVSAKYVMKTDDDALVRIDEVLLSLNRINLKQGLLYGLIESDSQPHRNPDSKWFISPEEWQDENYPPWAHGPGYVITHDIAEAVYKRHKRGTLKMFKLEDVAMGIWIADMAKDGLKVIYEKDERIYAEGCTEGYIVAHYQSPREMMCLWKKLQEEHIAKCCGD